MAQYKINGQLKEADGVKLEGEDGQLKTLMEIVAGGGTLVKTGDTITAGYGGIVTASKTLEELGISSSLPMGADEMKSISVTASTSRSTLVFDFSSMTHVPNMIFMVRGGENGTSLSNNYTVSSACLLPGGKDGEFRLITYGRGNSVNTMGALIENTEQTTTTIGYLLSENRKVVTLVARIAGASQSNWPDSATWRAVALHVSWLPEYEAVTATAEG